MLKIYTYHSTIYKYSNNITESTNKIYLYPYNDLKQQVVSQSIKISGNPNIYNYLDNYNNRVGFFTLNEPHKKLEIISETEIISLDLRENTIIMNLIRGKLEGLYFSILVDPHLVHIE